MKHDTFLRRLATGLSFGAVGIAIACSSDSDEPAATNAGGAGAPTTESGSLQPTPGGAATPGAGQGPIGATEGNPDVIALDPNRDPNAPIDLLASGAVACGPGGNSYCLAPNLTCCVGPMNAFSCAADAAQCPDGTASTTACSSAASCGEDQVCCRAGGGGFGGGGGGNPVTTTCEASCADGTQQICLDDAECGVDNVCNNGVCAPAPCTATSCAAGELCCRGQGGGGPNNAPACVAPGDDGLCPDNRRQVCDDDAQCPDGNTCAPLFGGGGPGGGGGGGGALVCTPPPCTPTSCDAGQVCCVGGGIGAPTCSAASDTGACPGNSRLVCITDAECAATPGTECLPNPNGGGGGQLSCRVPPPPPGDAGAPEAPEAPDAPDAG